MSNPPLPLWRKLGPSEAIAVGDYNAGPTDHNVDIFSAATPCGFFVVGSFSDYVGGTPSEFDFLFYRPINRAVELPAVNSVGLPATVKSAEAFREACGAGSLPDSGARKEYGTGAVRDASEGKGHFHSIPPSALRRIAKRFEDGSKKYSKDNWMKGIPLSHYQDSLTRHTLAWSEGDTSEDHLGAILWNAAAMAWTDEQIAAGKLPAELDDLPYRKR